MTDDRRQKRPPPRGPAVDDEDPDISPMDRDRQKTPKRDDDTKDDQRGRQRE